MRPAPTWLLLTAACALDVGGLAIGPREVKGIFLVALLLKVPVLMARAGGRG